MVTPRVSGKTYQRKSAKSAGVYLDATGNVMCIYTRRGDTLTAGERPIYGTKRLGELRQQIILGTNGSLLRCDNATIGTRHYELTDHLGNVMAVVSDRKTLSTDSVYSPVIISATDYYPFGFPMERRSWDLGDYRYGFNGQESDDEVYGEKQSYTAEFWQYDSRLGRRWNVDPVFKEYESPYACFGGDPVWFVDIFGSDSIFYNKLGIIINRVTMSGAHTYFLQHEDGNLSIRNKSYYQGNSYASFFGDRTNSGLFKNVDNVTVKDDNAVKQIVNSRTPNDETVLHFLLESRSGHYYDYKNQVLSKDHGKDNAKTAYLFNGILYNRNEMGNLLWGATTGKIGMTNELVWICSHGYTIMSEFKTDEVGEQNSIYKGRISYGMKTYSNIPTSWNYWIHGARPDINYQKTGWQYLNRTFIGDFYPGDVPGNK